MCGGTPTKALVIQRAKIGSLYFSATLLLARMIPDAPSVVCDEVPAVVVPALSNAGGSLLSVSGVVPGRIPSSSATTLRDPSDCKTLYGIISSLNLPDDLAAAAFWCELEANASWRSRVILKVRATVSL